MKYALASLQWTLYILMGSIIIPVSVAAMFNMDPQSTIDFVSRTLIVLGVAGILQLIFGHGLPIIEGPAGVWWGVFVLYAGVGSVMFGSQTETLRVLEFCFILSGAMFIILALCGAVDRLAKLFTPTVMGIYLVLLVMQLSGIFLKGMLGVTSQSGAINPAVASASALTIIVAYLCLKIKSLATYSTLASIVVGWLLFVLFDVAKPIALAEMTIKLPQPLPFGSPRVETGMIVNVLLLTILILTNLVASVRVVQIIFKKLDLPTRKGLKSTSIIAGLIHLLAGGLGAIGPVPISGSAAFIAQTRFTQKLPFIVGNLLIILIGLSPFFTSFFAALPPAVGYAALIPSFGIGTLIIAFTQLDNAEDKAIRSRCIAASLFVGVSIMFLPTSAFAGLSPLFTSLFSNGLIVGTLIAVVIEQLLLRQKKPATTMLNH